MMTLHRMKNKLAEWIIEDRVLRLLHKECRIRPSDVIVGSFPRSGRTWLRFFIGAYVNHHYGLGIEVDWDNFVTLAPGPRCDEESGLFDFPKGIDRVIFSHERPIGRHFPGRKVAYVTRNFLDILVSYYFFHKHRYGPPYKGSRVNDFVRREFDLEEAIDRINYFSRQLTKARDLLIMPYESMNRQPEDWFKRFILFTNYEFDEDAFCKAMEHSSFSSMHEMERERGRYDSPEAFHTRQAAINKAPDYLDKEVIEYVRDHLDQNLRGVLRKHYLSGGALSA